MRFLPALCVLFFSCIQLHAQNYTKAQQCIVENGTLKMVQALYDPATGNYFVTVNGSLKSFDAVYPANAKDYAQSSTWYAKPDPINVNGITYTKYGLPRILEVTDVKKTTTFNQVGVYQEAISNGPSPVIYIPVRRGCEFQPYLKVKLDVIEKKFYYDSNWKMIPTVTNAAYYRVATLDEFGKPVGQVTDYFITGEKQWQGYLSYMDPKDNNKDIMSGMATWFYKNGRKASEGVHKDGKRHGLYKSWYENGNPESEIEYDYGLLVGRNKIWYENGRPAVAEQYDSSETYQGKQVYYLEDGRVRYQLTYANGKPVTPCYNILEASGKEYEGCADYFTENKPVFPWRYTGAGSTHAIEDGALMLRNKSGAPAYAIFDFPGNVADLVNISASFSLDGGEAGLIWNVTDSVNFNYFMLTINRKWVAGSVKDGKMYGDERDASAYLSGQRYQHLTVLSFGGNVQFEVNGHPVVKVGNDYGFKTKGIGLMYNNGSQGARFESFLRLVKKN